MRRVLGAAVGTALGLFALTAPASAQFLTFVSATGNDANTCFVQHLQRLRAFVLPDRIGGLAIL
jgi:hypothetical protein